MKSFNSLMILYAILLLNGCIFAQNYQPDLNGDRFVNFSDFTLLAKNWKKSGSNLAGDINNNGTVNFQDLAILSGKWLRYSLVVFVDANAAPGGNGTSWNKAFIYLQDAIAQANDGYAIWVAKGIYKPDANSDFPMGVGFRSSTFQIPQGMAMYGGFPVGGGTFNQRNWINNETILSGDICEAGKRSDNSYNVVTGADNIILDGFVIADGNATGTSTRSRGSGMRNENVTNVSIANCTFRNNYAKYDGGAIYNYESSVSFDNCVFNENNCGDDGAGVYNSYTDTQLTNCSFFDNHCGNRGGGIYNYHSPAELINCLFNNNHADSSGGAVYNGYETVNLINCTISQNSANGNTGGIYNMYSSSVITNCIVWNNGKEIYNRHSTPHISYSDVKGCGGSGTNWDANCGSDEGNNIDRDPCFADEFALKSQSACINAGNNSALPPDVITDINGNPRFNGIVDMGAFESGGL